MSTVDCNNLSGIIPLCETNFTTVMGFDTDTKGIEECHGGLMPNDLNNIIAQAVWMLTTRVTGTKYLTHRKVQTLTVVNHLVSSTIQLGDGPILMATVAIVQTKYQMVIYITFELTGSS